jgi:uncharacterized damage-inducible protein DinB
MPALSQDLLAGFDEEMSHTRQLLECLPEGNLEFRPHEKSMTLGQLAGHVASITRWGDYVLRHDSRNLKPADGQQQFHPYAVSSREEALATFDKHAKDARALIAGAGDAELEGSWSLLMGEKTVFTMPRHLALRTWFLNHLIHHRGQLSVYLRLLNIPIPGMYGPSADTQAAMRAKLES